MENYTINQIVKIAQSNSEQEWNEVIAFFKSYNGEDDALLGMKYFLESHGFSRSVLLGYESKIMAGKQKFESTSPKIIKLPTWAVVAAASVTVFSGVLLNNYLQQESVKVIEPPLPIYLSNDGNALNKAMSLYKQQDYNKAISLFNQVSSDTSNYYKAVAYEMLEDYERSIITLNLIQPSSEYFVKSRIRLASIYYQLGKTDISIDLLNNLKPNNADEAQRIKALKLRLN
ncbi:MAG: tetratricopeptide repeat protein [Bacteroidota bacterium]|jgi:tetratricopeptide (TPR) repeat protein